METKEEILTSINTYRNNFPGDIKRSEAVLGFLAKHDNEQIISRKNFAGHITASAFIVNEYATALLLLKHKSLNRWLQPGGHVDASDLSLITSAFREASEETGFVETDLQLISNFIFDIDSHYIPENIRKQEPAHVHHDIRFLFKCLNSKSINISLDESTDSNWISFKALASNQDFDWVEEKIKRFIQQL